MFKVKRLSGWMALAVFATVGGTMVAADPAFAKVDVDKLTIDGEARVRYEIRVNTALLNTAAGQANESAGSHRIRIGVGYDLTPDVSFYAQVQDARIWGTEGSAGVGTSGIAAVSGQNQNGTGVDLHQGFIQVKNVLVPGLGLKVGRQEIMYGDHRLFGNFNWSQVGNSFDAGKIMWQSEMVDVDLFWARIVDTEAAAGCSAAVNGAAATNCSGVIFPVAVTKGTTDQDIYGTYVTLKPVKGLSIEPYYFLLKDSRLSTTTTGVGAAPITPQAADQARNFLGARINGKGGGLDATLEADWQFGGIANGAGGSQQHNLHINAEQAAARIGYTFEPVPMKPRIGIEVDYASGDPCVHGAQTCTAAGRFNTADNLYPTNHFHYGYMDLEAWKNMVGYSAMFDVKPSAVSKLQLNFWMFRLARTTDNMYRAGQVPYIVTGASNQAASLGRELDVHYWHTFKEKFLFELGFGHFWVGEILRNNPSLNNGSGAVATVDGAAVGPGNVTNNQIVGQTWAYTMLSVKF